MSPEEASRLECISFDSEEFAWAFAELVFKTHEKLSSQSACFNPFSDADCAYASDRIGRVYSVVYSVFGTVFGQSPKERYGGDLFLQAASFCDHLANDHIFSDGNKRTALIVTAGILHLRRVAFVFFDSSEPEQNDAYRLIQEVVSGDKDTEELAEAFRLFSRFE